MKKAMILFITMLLATSCSQDIHTTYDSLSQAEKRDFVSEKYSILMEEKVEEIILIVDETENLEDEDVYSEISQKDAENAIDTITTINDEHLSDIDDYMEDKQFDIDDRGYYLLLMDIKEFVDENFMYADTYLKENFIILERKEEALHKYISKYPKK